jgi:DNA-binding CsgD family transcriptional regulator
LIVADGATLTFRHPILRTAVYQGASLTQRQVAHRSLVETLSGRADEDRRAWHRAAIALHVDDEVADELERTAERARRRSGHAGACAALRRAAELSSSVERRGSRLAAAARSAWEAGRPDDAMPLLDEAGWEDDAEVYAELCHVRGEIGFRCGIPLEGAAILMDGAARVAATNPSKALEMLFDAALCATYAGDPKVTIEAGRRASELPISDSQPEAPFVELLTAVIAQLEARDTGYVTRLVHALDRVTDVTEPRWLIWAGAAAHGIGDEARDEAFLLRAEGIARRSMAVGTLAMVLERFSWKDMLNGRVAAASLHSGEGLQLASDSGLTNSACFHRAILAWAAALRGDRDTCLLLAELALETATKNGLAAHNSIANWAVGLLHMGLGQWETATTRLERASSAGPGTGHAFVAVLVLPDLVEASVRAGRFDIARPAAMRLAKYVQGGGPDWAMGLESRSRALVSRAPEVKERLLSEALLFHGRGHQAFGRARTLLLLGEHLRRERRRAEARPHLRSAIEVFEALRASPWEKRARAELRATGERARRREPSTLTDLTPQQIHIARLVAEGATNKEVAAQLFLSPRTVDYHLRNVFAKLGISSRTDLMRLRLDEISTESR